jgi:hypothetical protein
METDLPLEVIYGYKVHPAASLFPLLEGDEFESLVLSIQTLGLINPIILHNGMLIDGRNRLRAVEHLKTKYSNIELVTKNLALDVVSVSEFIMDVNSERRHLSPDQIAFIAAELIPKIQEEKKAKQESTQFKAGNNAGPDGRRGKEPVNTIPCSPVPRDIPKMHEQSTIGQVALASKQSHHKAAQAVAVVKAIEAGELPKETKTKILSGEVKLKDVAPKPKKKELTRDLQLELALANITQSINQYLSIEYASIRLLELAINSYLDSIKKEKR